MSSTDPHRRIQPPWPDDPTLPRHPHPGRQAPPPTIPARRRETPIVLGVCAVLLVVATVAVTLLVSGGGDTPVVVDAGAPSSSPAASVPVPDEPTSRAVDALEERLAEAVDASSTRCSGPATPVTGATYDCVATLPQGELPITVTTSDLSPLQFAYSGSAQFGSGSRQVSGSFTVS